MKHREHNVGELLGGSLDLAVALAEGKQFVSEFPGFSVNRDIVWAVWVNKNGNVLRRQWTNYSPSTNWEQGGAIIEKHGIAIVRNHVASLGVEEEWRAHISDSELYAQSGPTLLIAAMRCFVASKLGFVIELPEPV
jgi:hypothetical protein